MINKVFKVFKSVVIWTFPVVVLTCLLGKDHLILGTLLNLFRWIYFIVGLIFLYLSVIHKISKYLQIFISFVLAMLAFEQIWFKFFEENLNSSETESIVSLMTYNVYFKNASPNSTIANIVKHKPAILLVQELTPKMKEQLDNSIGNFYPYAKTLALNGTHGMGIYSKHRILSNQYLRNSRNLPFAQVVEMEIGSKNIRIINAHLASPAIAVENPDNFVSLLFSNQELRAKQIAEINSLITLGEFDAQFLIGDLNTLKYEPLFRAIKKDWVNLYEISGEGFGFNFPNSSKIIPILTLDYILVRGNLKGIETSVVEGGGSDHLAIFGKVEL